jgi:hypothetical protein
MKDEWCRPAAALVWWGDRIRPDSRELCGSVGGGRYRQSRGGKVRVRFRLDDVGFGGWRGMDSDYGQYSPAQAKQARKSVVVPLLPGPGKAMHVAKRDWASGLDGVEGVSGRARAMWVFVAGSRRQEAETKKEGMALSCEAWRAGQTGWRCFFSVFCTLTPSSKNAYPVPPNLGWVACSLTRWG